MIPEYQYRIKDSSILTPYFKIWIVTPLFKLMPFSIPANIITIFSNSLMYLALFISLLENQHPIANPIIISILIFMYAIGDHFDGMQAKRTQTSSALGEWFDHFMDTFNTGILSIILFATFKIYNPGIVVIVLSINYLTHTTTFYEQRKTGWLFFEKIGPLETLFMACGFILLNAIQPVHDLFFININGEWRLIEILALLTTIGPIVTSIQIISRAKIKETPYAFYMLMLGVLGWFIVREYTFNFLQLSTIISLYSIQYIGNLMRGHLINGKDYFPDLITPILLLLSITFEVDAFVVFILISAYLSLFIVYQFISSIYILRNFWVWSNPIKFQQKN